MAATVTDRLTAAEARLAEIEASLGGLGAVVVLAPSDAAAELAESLLERYREEAS